jgi:hypothetical protein
MAVVRKAINLWSQVCSILHGDPLQMHVCMMYEMLFVTQHVVNMGMIQNSEITTDKFKVTKL